MCRLSTFYNRVILQESTRVPQENQWIKLSPVKIGLSVTFVLQTCLMSIPQTFPRIMRTSIAITVHWEQLASKNPFQRENMKIYLEIPVKVQVVGTQTMHAWLPTGYVPQRTSWPWERALEKSFCYPLSCSSLFPFFKLPTAVETILIVAEK